MDNATAQPKRILVRGVNWLGDAVMTTPALLRLREKFPEAHLTMLCPEKLRDLWLHHPAVDEVATFADGEGLLSVAERLKTWTVRKALKVAVAVPKEEADKISADMRIGTIAVTDETGLNPQVERQRGFDLGLVLPNSPRSALEVFLARIPQRIGYSRPWRNFFLTQAVPPRANAVKMHKRTLSEINAAIGSSISAPRIAPPVSAHQIHEYLHLVASLGANPEPLAPLLFVTHEEIAVAKKKFSLDAITGPIFGLNPGAEYGPAKRWPVEKFITAANEIQKRTNCTWLLFGGKNDVALTSQIHSSFVIRHSSLDLAGRTTLRELMALLKSCHVLLTNDTGPMHVAAALGTPVVVPFGSTSPELTGPGLPGDPPHRLLKADVPCTPCFLRQCPIDFRCMHSISVEQVIQAILSV